MAIIGPGKNRHPRVMHVPNNDQGFFLNVKDEGQILDSISFAVLLLV